MGGSFRPQCPKLCVGVDGFGSQISGTIKKRKGPYIATKMGFTLTTPLLLSLLTR